MQTRLYINNELCHDLTQLQDYVRSLSYGSEIYSDILEYALCGDLSSWLHEHGHEEIAAKVDSIDKSIGDTDFVNILTDYLLGEASITKKPNTIQKPNYSKCFSCDISISSKSNKETVVLLSITPLTFTNENFEIKVSCGWGTKARVFNPSQYEGNTNYKESVSFHRRSNKEIGEIQVTIEGELVFKKSIHLPEPNPNTSLQSGSTSKTSELDDTVRLTVEHIKRIVQTDQSRIRESGVDSPSPTYHSKKEPEYIRTAGGLMPKEEWLRRREQERLAIEESQRKVDEERRKKEAEIERQRKEKDLETEREKMIECWRRKH